MDEAVNISHLTRRYQLNAGLFSRGGGTLTAIDDVSLTVRKGEAIGLLGPNGAGKTTLIKIMTTVLLPTSGSVSILGRDVVEDFRDIRAKINVVYGGDKGLYTRLTAWDNLKYFCNLYHVPPGFQDERIERLLGLVGLSDVASRRVEQFSRGMRQKLHLARGLINDPDILFLDEPTIGLDPVSSQAIRHLIRQLNEKGVTIFLTTHYMQEAEEICDRVAVINQGRIVLLDHVANIKIRFRRHYRVELTLPRACAAHSDLVETHRGHLTQVSTANDLAILTITTPDIIGTVRSICETVGDDRIVDFSVKTTSLEDAYLDIVQHAH